MSSTVGHARVSMREQDPEVQEAELRAAGAVRVFVDRGESSRVKDRPEWIACLDHLRDGDTSVMRRLDRIAAAVEMRDRGKTLVYIADVLGVGKLTVARALAKPEEPEERSDRWMP